MHLDLKHIALSLFLAIVTGLTAGVILSSHAYPDTLIKHRDTDLIKVEKDLEDFLRKLQTDTIDEAEQEIDTYCDGAKYKYTCKITKEEGDVIALEVFFNGHKMWNYGIVWNGERMFLIKEE